MKLFQLIMSTTPPFFFENFLVPEVCPQWANIICKICNLYGVVMPGKNSLGIKTLAMGYTCYALSLCCKESPTVIGT